MRIVYLQDFDKNVHVLSCGFLDIGFIEQNGNKKPRSLKPDMTKQGNYYDS